MIILIISLVQDEPRFSSRTDFSPPGGHAGQPREHPPGGVRPLPVPGPADAAQPRSQHRLLSVPQRVALDPGAAAQKMRRVLVPHSLHVHRGQLPGLRRHHQRPVLRGPVSAGPRPAGTGPAVHRADGAGGGGGAHPHHQEEQEALPHAEAPRLLQASGRRRVTLSGVSR